jgi:hypothetical protein
MAIILLNAIEVSASLHWKRKRSSLQKKRLEMTGIIIVKWVGATLVAYAMGTILLIQDMDKLEAIGYSWIPFTVNLIFRLFSLRTSRRCLKRSSPFSMNG